MTAVKLGPRPAVAIASREPVADAGADGFRSVLDDAKTTQVPRIAARPVARARTPDDTQPRFVAPRTITGDRAPAQPRTRTGEHAPAAPRTRTGDTLRTPVSRTQGLPTLRAPAAIAGSHPATASVTATASDPAGPASDSPTTDIRVESSTSSRVSQVIAGVFDALAALTGAPPTIDLPDPDAIADATFAASIGATDNAVPDTERIAVVRDARPERGPPPITPLEQAIHDLLASAPADHAAPTTTTTAHAPAPVHALDAPDAPDLPPPSHVHLVVGDGEDRVVLTVAVRGDDVHVAMRTPDDHLAANLARNAAVLDDALRTRGLALADIHADAEPDRRRTRDDARQPERDPDPQPEPFELEETT